ncbi:hypothetical protein POVWA2_035730 [Plasmodium ovale wallikeri]|uniref:Uncharacterized protein n=1 Tax=Plasmodium ovale wallikeri TaxID=864142 RepID=A0A1A8Z3L8_PLAOA|nr:hypothetical protein POVWA2_035730 [Plasmodium ovale wallikeri]
MFTSTHLWFSLFSRTFSPSTSLHPFTFTLMLVSLIYFNFLKPCQTCYMSVPYYPSYEATWKKKLIRPFAKSLIRQIAYSPIRICVSIHICVKVRRWEKMDMRDVLPFCVARRYPTCRFVELAWAK